MEFIDILYQVEAPLATITLNRPEIKNAFTLPMLESMGKALRQAADDPLVKVICITGAGGSFCSGGNVKDMAAGRLQSWEMKRYLWEHVQRIPLLFEDVDKPVIAAIDGVAFGGGFDLALACDFRFAADRAAFCSTFVRIGLAPGDGGAYFLPRMLGRSKALDILLTGRVIRMSEASDLGLVDRVVASDVLLPEVRKYAGEIAQWSLPAIRAIKRAVNQGEKSDLRHHLDYVSSQLALLSEMPEHLEAVSKLVAARKSDV